MKKIELLAPAGDLEKLKIAVLYGKETGVFGKNGGVTESSDTAYRVRLTRENGILTGIFGGDARENKVFKRK